MTQKFHILFLVLMVGFFATPLFTYACGTKTTKTEKSCCNKQKASKAEKKDCCNQADTKNHEDSNGCNGKCKNPSCSCPTVCFYCTIPAHVEANTKNYFADCERLKFHLNENNTSSGFLSIWLPPKIS